MTDQDKKTELVESDTKTNIVSQDNNDSKHNANTNPTSQQQLLSLAKTFAIDGSFLPIEKQMPIAERASKRERISLQRQQENIEKIITKAIGYCDNENAVNRSDQDWFNSFIELAEGISNKTMQGLWAKILAYEVNKPGSFSLKALKVFREMSIHDAKLFAKACSLACHENKKRNFRIITGCSQTPSLFNIFNAHRQEIINLASFGLTYGDILSLAENNLIYSQETETATFSKQQTLSLEFNGIELKITAQKANCVLSFYKFTPAGTELARLINDAPEMDYLQTLKSQLQQHFIISSKQ